MILYFRNSRGKMQKIAEFDNALTDKQAIDAANAEMQKFCDKRNYKIPYSRMWNEPYDGKMMTVFDLGSYTEFFYLDREIDIRKLIEEKRHDTNS